MADLGNPAFVSEPDPMEVEKVLEQIPDRDSQQGRRARYTGMTDFIVTPLPAGEADGAAPAGRRLLADGPSPCRRCLRRAEVGDPLLLLPYDPFTQASPYAGDGPVFVHANGCEPRTCAPGEVPDQVAKSMLSVRAYDVQAMMVDAEVLTGARLAERARALLRPGVSFLHVHFAGPGCFAFRVDPA